MEKIKLGIIILNYKTCNETQKCVSSIINFTSLPYKIYIIDNNSPDESFDVLMDKYINNKKVDVIKADANNGYSAGNNIGIKKAIENGCNVIYIINSDVEILNDALTIMTETLLSNNNYMMIGPSIIDNNNLEAQLPRMKLTLKNFIFARHPFCFFSIFRKISYRIYDIHKENVMSFEGSVSGCCFGIKSDDIKKINYLDENVFLYSEEDILAYKMISLGKKAVVNKNAKVWHKENISTKKEGNAFVRYHRWTSVFYLLKEYVKVNYIWQIIIFLWNIITWGILSLTKKTYRKLFLNFCKSNYKIISSRYGEFQ